jgi:hypothetical protein
MSSGKKKSSWYDTQTNNAIADAGKPSALQQKIDAKALNWMNWEDSTAPKDITQAPGMDAQMDVYRMANQRAEADRIGGGALNLADTNSAYSDQVKTQNKMAVRDITGQGLHEGLQGLKNEALGLANQSTSADAARKSLSANLALQNQNNYYHRPKKKAWWETLLEVGQQGAQLATTAAMGAGM